MVEGEGSLDELVSATPLTMSTLEIAGLMGKRHDHVLRDADKMLADLGETANKFGGFYKGENGRDFRVLKLPKRDLLQYNRRTQFRAA